VTRAFSDASRVEVGLETGRTHQIRVHFAEAGFPLLGDKLYGGKRAQSPVIDRQALHAWRLSFPHPRTGKKVSVEAPVPADFAAAEKRLGET
jgi:23S rRNA pseudouridine1911/1915/1917 synthase